MNFEIRETLSSGDSYDSSIELDYFSNIYDCLIYFLEYFTSGGPDECQDERNWLLERAKFHGLKKHMSISNLLKEKDINMQLRVEIFFSDNDEDYEEHPLISFYGLYDYDKDEIINLDMERYTFDEFIDENKYLFVSITNTKIEKLKTLWSTIIT